MFFIMKVCAFWIGFYFVSQFVIDKIVDFKMAFDKKHGKVIE